MNKVLLATSLTSILLLGACEDNESDTKESKQEQKGLSIDQEEKIQKEELRKVIKQLDKTVNSDDIGKEDVEKLDKMIMGYEDKTKDFEQIDIAISDPIINASKTYSVMSDSLLKLEKFKEDNPELEQTYDLMLSDISYHGGITLTSISNEYEDLDSNYKNEVLGKELNTTFTDLLFSDETGASEVADGLGVMAIGYDEHPTDEQLKQLPSTDYRDVFSKYGSLDEPNVSKKEYNSLVKDYNELAPKFLHYKEATEMVSADENLSMGDIRNGIVGADTDREVSDYEDDMEEDTDLAEDEEDDDEEELKWVEDEDGNLTLEGEL